jgi:coenzyme PQQ synthesis protein D (PqqD)
MKDTGFRESDLCRRYGISREVIAQRMGNETVVVHTGTNRIYELNGTGARIWELIDSAADRTAIEAGLLSEFHADRATVAAGVEGMLARLVREKLIVALPLGATC